MTFLYHYFFVNLLTSVLLGMIFVTIQLIH